MLTDYLVIGSGIAGLSFALKVSEHLPESTITIVTKSEANEGSTKYAQGGIAVVSDFINDSFEKHIHDTLAAGDGLSKPEIVKFVVEKAPNRLEELLRYGVDFDKNHKREYDLVKEGGHSSNRILHHNDYTGIEIEESLLKVIESRPNISIVTNFFALDLIIENDVCCGVYVQDVVSERLHKIVSKITLLATGGIGQVFDVSTNPIVSTGDGIAMAYRAKAVVSKMEFVQFHPTALYNPDSRPSFLISEAVRGKGAVLRTINGKRFMSNYHKEKDLATRDIVARAIATEINKTKEDYLFLDCSSISVPEFERCFPKIKKKCESLGLNITNEGIPVTPAAHFICGGIKTDICGKTSIPNLYACGECANTGLNGANRLASNSLLESLVFSHESAMNSISIIRGIQYPESIQAYKNTDNKISYSSNYIQKEFSEVNRIMSNSVGVYTDNKMLNNARRSMKIKYKRVEELCMMYSVSPKLYELRNIIQVALLILQQSIERNENKGVFFNRDLIK
ncbi:MAG: L-aspartate oxidase [Flavobacteriales bacterium]|jgi:L-aspartate oxidase|nr:L-aspartate oxidase [Flavobacteriales bacterium]MBT6174493.1 L-aspartate oxidase [Flavobacteriales bacterium]MBT7652168.1 L-aspartate oxidase [Flavobacteriales bacterium]